MSILTLLIPYQQISCHYVLLSLLKLYLEKNHFIDKSVPNLFYFLTNLLRVRVMVLNVTFKNISMEETGVPREIYRQKYRILHFVTIYFFLLLLKRESSKKFSNNS